jgi:hypothetical protein
MKILHARLKGFEDCQQSVPQEVAISAQHPRARRLTSAIIVSVACHAATLTLVFVGATRATSGILISTLI